jgi:hypothetical protein
MTGTFCLMKIHFLLLEYIDLNQFVFSVSPFRNLSSWQKGLT